jgi:hypothetical protein
MRNKNYLAIAAGLLLPLASPANGAKSPALKDMEGIQTRPAPAELELDSYMEWAAPLLRGDDGADRTSAFTSRVFDWYKANRDLPLPKEVYADKERIHVNVARPIAETDEMEANSEIEVGNTVGAEVYAEQSGTVKEALATMLFRWGKPTGSPEGKTNPPGGQFGRRADYFAANPEWGPGAYASLAMRRGGIFVHDLTDRYLLLVRGSEEKGYDVLMQFVKPGGKTDTQQVFAIAMIRPVSPGKVSYKISTRFQGQSYMSFTLRIGRSMAGFNVNKIRAVQEESNGLLKELQTLGEIKNRNTDLQNGE